MTDISPTGKPDDSSSYKAQYQVSPAFRKYWQGFFKGKELSDKEIHQLTDIFVKNISDNMNQVLNWALKEQKKREDDEKRLG